MEGSAPVIEKRGQSQVHCLEELSGTFCAMNLNFHSWKMALLNACFAHQVKELEGKKLHCHAVILLVCSHMPGAKGFVISLCLPLPQERGSPPSTLLEKRSDRKIFSNLVTVGGLAAAELKPKPQSSSIFLKIIYLQAERDTELPSASSFPECV